MESHAVVLTAGWADEKRDSVPPGSGAILIEPHRYHELRSWSFPESTPSGEPRAPKQSLERVGGKNMVLRLKQKAGPCAPAASLKD